MKLTAKHLAIAFLFQVIIAGSASSQRIDIPMAQPDGRFTVFAQRYWSSTASSESYFFYVQNNTDDEYTLEIKVTLHLACEGWKTFSLGYGGIRLKPKETYGPPSGGNYSVLGGSTEEKLKCRLKDGNGFSFLHTATFHMTNIVNVTQQKAAEARRVEEEKENKRLAAEERKRQDEQKRKEEELARQKRTDDENKKNALAKQQSTDTKQNPQQKASEDDFWSDKKTTTQTGTSSSNPNYEKLPDFFNTTDGRYWKKSNGALQEISYDDYTGLKHKQETSIKKEASEQKMSEADQKKLVDKIAADNKAATDAYFKSFDDANRNYQLNVQAMNAGRAVEDSKKELAENANLSGNYQSVDQLLAEFDQKMAAVNRTTTQLTEQRNNQLNAAVDARFNQPGYEASIGEGMKLVGSIVHSAKAAKEKKEAEEQLKVQKQLALNRIAAEEKKLLTGIRTDLFSRFREASFPNSTSKLSTGTIYFFAYSYDPAQLGTKQTTLYVSNVFQVDKYSDGTWPFKNSIVNEVAKLTPYTEVIHGYYANPQEAERMRQSMIDIFAKTGGTTKLFNYKGKKSALGAVGNGKQDFWENGQKQVKDSTQKMPAGTKDDFWNN